VTLVAESDQNSPRFVRTRSQGGYGLNWVWSDDFHHAAHALFTGEREGYYQDFGGVANLVKALNEGFVFQGQQFKFWGKPRGEKPEGMPLPAHVICIQNHDQVGNRAMGGRLTSLVPRGVRKLLAALLLLAPETPLLWMGQEYDEGNPFQFFTDYGDPALQKAVSEGRRREFKDFASFGDEFPDPQHSATFERSRLNWQFMPEQQEMHAWYRQLLCLRKKLYGTGEKRSAKATASGQKSIELRVPAENPLVVVHASWNSQAIADAESWPVLLASDEDDARVKIAARPDVAGDFRRSFDLRADE
jgi:maltooligosyltrehalose trehalohydrolase